MSMQQPDPQRYWDVTLLEAEQAKKHRQWARLLTLLIEARDAPDAPNVQENYDREDVCLWHDLWNAHVLHLMDAQRFIREAIHLLLARTQERFGATGAADPTVQELCAWLRAEAETVDFDMIETIDEAVEERHRAKGWPRSWLRTTSGRGPWVEQEAP